MDFIGIDFGTSGLRIAGASAGQVPPTGDRLTSCSLPFVIDSLSPVHVTPLKRLADFENASCATPFGTGSISLAKALGDEVLSRARQSEALSAALAVPPCFSQRQRSALRKIMTGFGLTQVRLVDDTLAALLASPIQLLNFENVLVYSWGAGIFSSAAYSAKQRSYQLIAQEGTQDIGGIDIDISVAEIIRTSFTDLRHELVLQDPGSVLKLMAVAEEIKQTMHSEATMTLPMRCLVEKNGTADTSAKISTDLVTQVIHDAAERTLNLVSKVVVNSFKGNPDVILCVGGMTRSRIVIEALQRRFSVPIVHSRSNSEVLGALIVGRKLRNEDVAEQPSAGFVRPQATTGSTQIISQGTDRQDPTSTPVRDEDTGWVRNFTSLIEEAQRKYETHELEGAIAGFNDVIDALSKFRGHLYITAAGELVAAGRSSEALMLLRQANARAPKDRHIALEFAKCSLEQAIDTRSRRNPKLAAQLAEEGASCLRKFSTSNDAQLAKLLGALLYFQGIGLGEQGKLAPALLVVDESVKVDPRAAAYAKYRDNLRANLKALGPNSRCPCGSGRKYKQCCERAK
jgi:hypothetical protein